MSLWRHGLSDSVVAGAATDLDTHESLTLLILHLPFRGSVASADLAAFLKRQLVAELAQVVVISV